MEPTTYNAFPELAQVIFDWWETLALAVAAPGLVINFFFSMHKGRVYRGAFVLLLLGVVMQIYIDVITATTRHPSWADVNRPILYTAWAWTVWSRASLYLRYLYQLRTQYDTTIEQVLSVENQVIPWREVALFTAQMERWQKWVLGVIALIFATGVLYSNVNKIETKQTISIAATRQAVVQDSTAKLAALALKRHQDSLFLEQLLVQKQEMQLVLRQLEQANKARNSQELSRTKATMRALNAIEKSVRERLQTPIPKIQPPARKEFKLPSSLPPVRPTSYLDSTYHFDSLMMAKQTY
ncbi:hypothetical protein [Spirosoma sordidisoli]|uniref:Transmembrane protein n=1 Tax=Spirosoma sordidisoli TaxID=2502893 RepID=A0A4V1RWL1_9BACT|nr:hypothetical protein [Spirosoma sordidisoli]RYC70648.1 hypothetical protein EQG79_00415 [Spirosoma sordidisoli]